MTFRIRRQRHHRSYPYLSLLIHIPVFWLVWKFRVLFALNFAKPFWGSKWIRRSKVQPKKKANRLQWNNKGLGTNEFEGLKEAHTIFAISVLRQSRRISGLRTCWTCWTNRSREKVVWCKLRFYMEWYRALNYLRLYRTLLPILNTLR